MTWTPPSFDQHAFAGRRVKAVSATRRHDGSWDTTGISFNDYGNMHTQRRVRVQERRLPTPIWAVRDAWLRILLVTYLEERFYCRPAIGLDLTVRLDLARRSALYYAPRKRELLDQWLDDYHIISRTRLCELSDEQILADFLSLREVRGQLPIDVSVARAYMTGKKLSDLEIQIQNIDTDLVLTDKGHAEIIVAIVYLYYRLGWDSVTVAEELGLKSPHVRQVLKRLHSTWRGSLSHLEEDVVTAEEQYPQNGSAQGGLDQVRATSSAVTIPFDELFSEPTE